MMMVTKAELINGLPLRQQHDDDGRSVAWGIKLHSLLHAVPK